MAKDYDTFLAGAVLSEQRIISYRLLGRELKVHSDVAKKMLYDFHKIQTSKNPGSLSATYLLDGVPGATCISEAQRHQKREENTPIPSSSFMGSSAPQAEEDEEAIPSRLIVLTRDSGLEAAKSRFEYIHSIHIYSLQPSVLRNMQVLSDCNHVVATQFSREDPLVVNTQYGVIVNSRVRRRTAPRLATPGVASVANSAAVGNSHLAGKLLPRIRNGDVSADKSSQKSEAKSVPSNSSQDLIPKSEADKKNTAPQEKKAEVPITLKRDQSDLFKMFSKKPKPKCYSSNDSVADSPESMTPIAGLQNASRVSPQEEQADTFDSDDDQAEHEFSAMNRASKSTRSARSEREEQLRKMMEDEEDDEAISEEMPDAPSENPPDASQDELQSHLSQHETLEPSPPMVSGGRRRGKRKVMKKIRTRDEDNMLVTTEQPVWESFSEDEPPPSKQPMAKQQTSSAAMSMSSSSTSATKGRKGDSKGGDHASQKGIASFFGKR